MEASGICLSTNSHMFSSQTWIIDSGASQHISNNKNLFNNLTHVHNTSVLLPDSATFPVKFVGDITLSSNIHLHNIFYVRCFKFILLSVCSILQDFNLCVQFTSNNFSLRVI